MIGVIIRSLFGALICTGEPDGCRGKGNDDIRVLPKNEIRRTHGDQSRYATPPPAAKQQKAPRRGRP